MNLIRAVHNMYELLTSTKIDQLSKSIWSTVAAVLWSLFRNGSGDFESGFIGEACNPTAGGASPTVTLAPGLALYFDATEPDLWRGKVKPLFLRAPQIVEFDINNDAYDRIDSVFIRPKETEEDEQERWLFDPIQKAEYRSNEPGRVRYGFETIVVKGTPNVSPAAPDTPSGWLRVADVRRPSGQVNVTTPDITDLRTIMTLTPGNARLDWLNLKKGAEIDLEDGDGGFTRLFRGANGSLNLVTNLMGALPDGIMNLGTLTAYSHLAADTLRGALGDIIEIRDSSGGEGGLRTKSIEAFDTSGVWIKDKVQLFDGVDFRAFISLNDPLPMTVRLYTEMLSGGLWAPYNVPFFISKITSNYIDSDTVKSDKFIAPNVAVAGGVIDGDGTILESFGVVLGSNTKTTTGAYAVVLESSGIIPVASPGDNTLQYTVLPYMDPGDDKKTKFIINDSTGAQADSKFTFIVY